MKSNICLIGMPSSGKSTLGGILSKVLNYSFLDSDVLIRKAENKSLQEIINEVGILGFIKIENKVNSSINCKRTVISTGGSVVYGREAMENLKKISYIVYLKLPYHKIEKRIGDLKKRGVVLKKGQTLRDLYEERCKLYEEYADFTVEINNEGIRDCIDKILIVLGKERVSGRC